MRHGPNRFAPRNPYSTRDTAIAHSEHVAPAWCHGDTTGGPSLSREALSSLQVQALSVDQEVHGQFGQALSVHLRIPRAMTRRLAIG